MFLNLPEMNLIRRDAKEMLYSSEEAVQLAIKHRIPVNPVQDSVYEKWTADSWSDGLINCKGIQKIVNARDTDILRWGILDKGDCIFWIDPSVDLSVIQCDSATVLAGSSPLVWVPAPIIMKPFYNALVFRVGDNQIFQPLPCTQQK